MPSEILGRSTRSKVESELDFPWSESEEFIARFMPETMTTNPNVPRKTDASPKGTR